MPKSESETKSNMSVSPFAESNDGGVYLLVVDDSLEFEAALRRVQYLAEKNKGKIALLYVIEDEGYLHWKFIEKRIQKDKRQEAESLLWGIAQRIYESCGQRASFYIKEGKTRQEVVEIIGQDETIRALVLGASSTNSNPLISYFTGKGLSELRVPLVIVPDRL